MEILDYILQSVNDTVMAYDVDEGAYTLVSASIEPLTGHKAKEFREKKGLYKSLVYAGDKQRVREFFEDEGYSQGEEIAYRILNANRQLVPVCEKRVFFTDPANKHQIILSVIQENHNPVHRQEAEKQRTWVLNALIDAQETLVFKVDKNGTLTYVNDAYLRLLGYKKNELLGKPFWSFVYPDDIPLVKIAYKKILKNSGTVVNLLHRKLDVEGNIHWVSTNAVSVVNKKSEIIEIQGSGFDITEILNAQITVRDNIEQVNFYLDSVTDAFFIVDNDWKIIRVNKGFEKQFHKERDKIIGLSLWEVMPKLKGTAFEQEFRKAVESRQAVEFSTHTQRTKKWIRTVAYPSKEGLTVLLKNFTSEKLAQEHALWITNNLEGIINNTEDLIWSIDTQKVYVFVNDAYKTWLQNNFEITHVEGSKLYEQLYDSQQEIEQWEHYYDRVLSGERFNVRYESNNKFTGEKVTFEVNFNPILDEYNKVTGAGCFAHNVTESLKAGQAIQEQNERLRNIASLSSHELRRPVASILGLVDILDKKNLSNPENLEIIGHLETASNELDNVIRAIVDKTFIEGII